MKIRIQESSLLIFHWKNPLKAACVSLFLNCAATTKCMVANMVILYIIETVRI